MNKVGSKKKLLVILLSIFVVTALYIPFRLFITPLLADLILNNIEISNRNKLTQISLATIIANDQKSLLGLNNGNSNSFSSSLNTTNPKIIALRKFLIDYNSPMYVYADVFVTEADKYGLDWRLVASISGVESAFGTITPGDTNNGWGWRGGPGGAYSDFDTFADGIVTVTRGLATGYGITLTPFEIERAYCPPCYANPSHAWAWGVTKFMNELDYYLKNLEKM